MARFLNLVGLVLNFAGALMLFIWAPPQPSFEEGAGLALEDITPLEDGHTVRWHNIQTRKQRLSYSILSRLALALIAIGFLLQLVAIIRF